MKYDFTFKVEGNWYQSVNADSFEEAEDKIANLFNDANFGALQFVNGRPLFCINVDNHEPKWYMSKKETNN